MYINVQCARQVFLLEGRVLKNHVLPFYTMTDYSTPMMFQPENPFPISYGPDTSSMDIPSSLSNVGMETPANLFNENFNEGMGLWKKNLPQPTIFDSYEDAGLDETAQSNNEIVQKVLLRASDDDFHQFEFFFVNANAAAHDRNDYSFRNFSPMEATTLHQMQQIMQANPGVTVKNIVETFRPLGFFFTYVEKTMTRESKLVAYTLGGLCDVLNVWHVPTVPGTRLYFVLYKNGTKCQIVPYAGLHHPLEKNLDPAKDHPWNMNGYTGGVAIIDVGIVCANSGRPIQQEKNHNYLVEASNINVPSTTLPNRIGSGSMATDPTIPQVQGNILRVKLNAIYWQYFA